MRIGIDARPLRGIETGIGQYTKKLVQALTDCAPEDEFVLFSNREIVFDPAENCMLVGGGKLMGNIWLQTVLPRLLRQYRIELFHSPMFVLPLVSRVPAVITIHDLVHRVFPETTDWKNRLPLNVLLPPSINRARRIIVVSEHTKGDLIKYHHVDPERIRVIYLGNDQRFHQIKDISGMEKVRANYDLPRRYILTVGTLEPRKNLVGLFKAFSILLKKIPDLKHQLVVVGARGWHFHGIFTALRDFGLEGRVVFTDYVSNENLPLIYKGADLFVFPSLYEGFGLPPLEAMASGIPIIVSRVASLPEVVGEAAVLVNPYDPEELSRAMEMVLFDKKKKTDMVIKGLEQVKKFSWEKAARETRAVYREVLAGKEELGGYSNIPEVYGKPKE